MLLRLAAIALGTTLICTYDIAAFAEDSRTQNDLAGPVRTVTTKSQGQSHTEIYNEAGHLIRAVIFAEHEHSTTLYQFVRDQHGTLREEIASYLDGTPIYRKRFAYTYDSQGRETAAVAATEEGELHHVIFTTYDRQGNISESLFVTDTTAQRNVFDVLGHIIYSAHFKNGNVFSEVRHAYDQEGRLRELTSYDAEGTMTGRLANEYDASGRRVRTTTEKFHAGNSSTWITTYEHDAMGNWIKEFMSEGTPTSQDSAEARRHAVQERTIEYYDSPETKTP
jgi:hypothetical protein